VVWLTSLGHRRSDIHLEDLNFRKRPYDPWSAYGQSKTAKALFAVGLNRPATPATASRQMRRIPAAS
jgi:hypothetical protein